MEEKHLALERVPQTIQINFSFSPYPGAELTTIQVTLQEGALLLDAIRQCRMEHHVPVYLEHSFLSTAQTIIHESRRMTVDEETRRANQRIFSKELLSNDSNSIELDSRTANQDIDHSKDSTLGKEADLEDELALQRSTIANYRNHTSQFYTQPEENMFPEAYHTLVHSPVPSLFDSILEVERDYAREVDALLSARDAEINDIQTKHDNALVSETPQRNLTHLTTRYVEVKRMGYTRSATIEALEVLKATYHLLSNRE
ncbi:hypothetical protein BGZ76_002280 [Entomortierella beljakovae]|nr:hypothetical protein BGZ76_002280 [Entomortierella beljakovae]